MLTIGRTNKFFFTAYYENKLVDKPLKQTVFEQHKSFT